MNLLEKTIKFISPEVALRRSKARYTIDVIERGYEAARPSRLRKKRTDRGSGDAVIAVAGDRLRVQARYLDENHDLAKGVLNCLVNNVVGTGIRVEPHVKNKSGELLIDVNKQLLLLFNNWILKPDVTWELHWNEVQRLTARSWFRDGEVLVQLLQGNISSLDHGTVVPFSVELIESDLLPFDLNDAKKKITQGVEKNDWGRPRAYHLYKDHPGNSFGALSFSSKYETKRITADSIVHLKLVDRIRQTRGVSIFASVLTRLDDVKDYEESERIAARVAAAMCAFIKRSADATHTKIDEEGNRLLEMKPGMIFDNLLPGEDISLIESNRPNNQLENFRNSQLRAIASGTCTSFSSISKNYNGTYSAQRQELVEQSIHYAVLREYFIERFVRPVWQNFVKISLTAGLVKLPTGTDELTITDADFRGSSIPWIDPEKEINAITLSVQAGLKSRSAAIRELGNNPADTFEQIKQDFAQEQEAGLKFTTSPLPASGEEEQADEPKKEAEPKEKPKPKK